MQRRRDGNTPIWTVETSIMLQLPWNQRTDRWDDRSGQQHRWGGDTAGTVQWGADSLCGGIGLANDRDRLASASRGTLQPIASTSRYQSANTDTASGVYKRHRQLLTYGLFSSSLYVTDNLLKHGSTLQLPGQLTSWSRRENWRARQEHGTKNDPAQTSEIHRS